ncbi:DegQ family serine endoprotease [Motiliproteus sp. MSK22-1]|uniref:DegQ family serine endoprotease n=1 Tax=Motiliproteus sp. MSK22-1 TaxID=1897630 RepID=UPI000976DF5A|nr:DegQ family serine endoprotease [Motiliproteus sp. MSK22-1]OMH38815.1 serine endoprotease DegQ [Motiliproteus sp. MSK22-1]
MGLIRILLLVLPLLFNPILSQAALPLADAQGRELPSLAPLLKKVTPAVVNISTFTTQRISNPLLQDPFFRRFFNIPQQQRQQQTQSAGSGVIIDAKNGLVITNHHVIKNADEIHISLTDERQFQATLIGSDPEVDLALLKIKADNLKALPLANSDQMEVGDFVIAIGNPFGLGQTVTTGIVSALGRSGLGIEGFENFIQTDASINPGNSGGALVNLRGELIGINTAIIAPGGGNVGIGFAIPSNMAQTITNHLKKDGQVKRGLLGIVMQDLTPELSAAFNLKANQKGVLITQVVPDSAADKAGDIVLRINNKRVKQTAQLRSRLGVLSVGDAVQLQLLRDGSRLTIFAQMEALASQLEDGEKLHQQLVGARLANSPEGVVIAEVKPGSRAAKAGFQEGDRVISVNRIPINNLQQLKQITNSRYRRILLLIDRDGIPLYLALSR